MIKISITFKVCHFEALLRLVWTLCLLRKPTKHLDDNWRQHYHKKEVKVRES